MDRLTLFFNIKQLCPRRCVNGESGIKQQSIPISMISTQSQVPLLVLCLIIHRKNAEIIGFYFEIRDDIGTGLTLSYPLLLWSGKSASKKKKQAKGKQIRLVNQELRSRIAMVGTH